MAEVRASVPKPLLLAMVPSDGAYREPVSGKWFIFGVFEVIHLSAFPSEMPMLTTYVALTACRGHLAIRLRLVGVDEDLDPLSTLEFEVEFNDPRETQEIIFRMARVNFPSAGEYRLQLFVADELLVERRIIAVQKPKGP